MAYMMFFSLLNEKLKKEPKPHQSQRLGSSCGQGTRVLLSTCKREGLKMYLFNAWMEGKSAFLPPLREPISMLTT